jgi:hypothetical protein
MPYVSPKATFETMVAASRAADKDAMVACFDTETKGYIQRLEELTDGSEDPEGVESSNEFSAAFKDATVEYGKEEITGDTATLEITKDGEKETVAFNKEDGNWKISLPEMAMAVEMMESMPKMMEGMVEGMMEGMGEAIEEAFKPEEAEAMEEQGDSQEEPREDAER